MVILLATREGERYLIKLFPDSDSNRRLQTKREKKKKIYSTVDKVPNKD